MDKKKLKGIVDRLNEVQKTLGFIAADLEEIMDNSEAVNEGYDLIEDAILCVDDAQGAIEEAIEG